MDLPFFVPSSTGPLSAFAQLPRDEPADVAVVLLAGGRAGKLILKLIGRDLADAGFASLRFDYPGTGTTPTTGSVQQRDLVSLSAEVVDWWRRTTGASNVSIVGHCLGARLALSIAARDPSVASITGIHLPMRDPSLGKRLRSKVRALDARGPRLAERLVPGVRPVTGLEEDEDDHLDGVEEDLVAAATHARIRLLYGSEDKALGALDQTLSTLPVQVTDRISTSVRADARLHGMPERGNFEWIRSQTKEALTSR